MKTSLFLLLAMTSCVTVPPSNRPAARFDAFVDRYFEALLAFEPSSATSLGFHAYDRQLEDFSKARRAARIAELHALSDELAALQRGTLTPDQAIDARMLSNALHADLLGFEVIKPAENNPMHYAGLPGSAVDGLMKRNFAPPAQRLEAMIVRLEKIPSVYASARINLVNPPRVFTEIALAMSKGSVGFFKDSVAPWARQAAAADSALLAHFEAANTGATQATADFARWLEHDLLPRSTGTFALGEQTYRAKLAYEEMIDLPLPELLARGEAQLARDGAAFIEVARGINPKLTPAQVMHALSDVHPTPDDLIPSVRRSVEQARQFLIEKDLVTVPSEVRAQVEETPPYARSGTFASMDTPGPYETVAKEAFYYVTPVEPDWTPSHKDEHLRSFNPWVTSDINVHECYPGHYLQFLYAPRYPTKTRKLMSASSNVEGWAHYAEQMMIEQGFGARDPRFHLAQLQEALLRDVRYVVSVKLHTQGMSIEDGARMFEQKAYQEPANALAEARRGAFDPTYLYYTFGKLQVQQLRDDYLASHPGATLKQFHDAFVAQGGLPIVLIRTLLLPDPGSDGVDKSWK